MEDRSGDGEAHAVEGGLPRDLEDWSSPREGRGIPWGVIDIEAARVAIGGAECGGDGGRDREAMGEDLSQCASGKAMIRN